MFFMSFFSEFCGLRNHKCRCSRKFQRSHRSLRALIKVERLEKVSEKRLTNDEKTGFFKVKDAKPSVFLIGQSKGR